MASCTRKLSNHHNSEADGHEDADSRQEPKDNWQASNLNFIPGFFLRSAMDDGSGLGGSGLGGNGLGISGLFTTRHDCLTDGLAALPGEREV